ncbi:putative PPE family protein PPE32 [Mycobacterium attenuatum]|nr:putative PPE family protein PPE32 [Mycobacterium attenuatum]
MISLMDFAGLPPEVNSARMYAGPGATSLMTAAGTWQALAAELTTAASSYQAVVAELTGGLWLGPSSAAMAAAVAPHVLWMNTTAARAQQTASQLGSAAAAYEAAVAATVPPPAIEVNRALLASLVATNILGQNAPAIAATEAQYSEMWAQDAAAMYGYAGAAAAATRLTPFTAPKQDTNPTGTAAQSTAVTQAAASATGASSQTAFSSVPDMLQSLSSGTFPGSNLLLDFFNSYPIQTFNSLSASTVGYQILSEGLNFDASGLCLTLAPAIAVAWNPLIDSLTATTASDVAPVAGDGLAAGLGSTLVDSYGSGAGAGASAGLGQAASVGKLSVPQTWAGSPAIRLAASALPVVGLDGVPQAVAASSGGFYGMPPMGPVASVVNAPRGDQTRPRAGSRHRVIPALGESGMREDPAARWVAPSTGAHEDAAACERDELNQLRKALADVSRQRDVLKRTAAALIKEARDN